MKGVAILYEDDELLVLNKPSGLAVQGGAGVGASLDTLLSAGGAPHFLVHRLDRDTSGIILTAKTSEAAARCAAFFRDGRVEKHYLALCAGSPPEQGHISEELAVRGKKRPAETSYRLIARGSLSGEFPCSLLDLKPATGRLHQLRRHLSGRGFPILGDDKYGDFALNRALRKNAALKRLLLHAVSLSFPGFPLVCAPLPEHFVRILELAGWKENLEFWKNN
ncbi:RNA pseudouridine synthase [Spirochaetia bacterium]|nr:RNA pseudouridine synthase [Spirochaetia bacterium]